MSFQPLNYIGQPLTALMQDLPWLTNHDLFLLGAGDISLHHAPVKNLSIEGDTCLPCDHPEVQIPGVVLERYLGGGGQGCVFAGRVLATGKIVAVKVLAPSVGALRGVREALLTARVRHPNVLRVLRSQPVGGCWIVVMEFVLGESLATGPELPHQAEFFRQLAEAIAAVAAAKLVHRDIKPANILVRRADGTPVLVDFGMAVDLGSPPEIIDEISGTPFFVPPEAWRYARPEPSWDAYGLGVTAAVVMGWPKHFSTDITQLRRAKLSGEFDRSVIEMLRGSGNSLGEWASRLLDASPARRLDALGATNDRLAA